MTKQLEALIARAKHIVENGGLLARDTSLALIAALEQTQRANAAQDDHINQQQDSIDKLEKGHLEAAKQIQSWQRLAKQNIAEREKDIAELDAARKRIAELENDEVRQRLANAEHQLHMAELSKHNLRASRRAQFHKRRAAEKRIAELEQELIKPLPIGELIHRLEMQTNEPWGEWWQRGMSRNNELEGGPLAVKLPDRKDTRFWAGDAFEFDTLGYVMAVEEAIRAAGGTVDEGK